MHAFNVKSKELNRIIYDYNNYSGDEDDYEDDDEDDDEYDDED